MQFFYDYMLIVLHLILFVNHYFKFYIDLVHFLLYNAFVKEGNCMTISERFILARKSKHLSQKEVADLVGVGSTAISRIEIGKNNPSERTIKLFCQELHISEHWLRTGEGAMADEQNDDVIKQLCQQYSLGPAGAALLRAIARAFAELPPAARDEILDDAFEQLRLAKEEADRTALEDILVPEDEDSSETSADPDAGIRLS